MIPSGNSQVRYERPSPSVARIVLARQDARNAQGLQMTYELNECFNMASRDDTVRVIVLSADGGHFSAGHDMAGDGGKTVGDFPVVGTWGSFASPGAEGRYCREREIYFDMCERWRNIPKPTIAQVQGACIGGGLMLAWVCDLIVAADDARFRDPTLDFGLTGAEFFMHPWEIGVRKAKEWLFTSDWLSAEQAEKLGMVNRVIARDNLDAETLALAEAIAKKSSFVLKVTKEAINQSQDAMGRRTALMHAFSLHQLSHAHNQALFGSSVDPSGLSPKLKKKVQKRDSKATGRKP